MNTITNVIAYLFAKTSDNIHALKIAAYSATEHEKYAYISPDGKTFRNDRPPDEMIEAGWKYGKVKYRRALSFMRPGHAQWTTYQQLKRHANLLMVAKLILKATNGEPQSKESIDGFVADGILRSQAGTLRAQRRLGRRAYRVIAQAASRLEKDPARYAAAAAWAEEREARKVANA